MHFVEDWAERLDDDPQWRWLLSWQRIGQCSLQFLFHCFYNIVSSHNWCVLHIGVLGRVRLYTESSHASCTASREFGGDKASLQENRGRDEIREEGAQANTRSTPRECNNICRRGGGTRRHSHCHWLLCKGITSGFAEKRWSTLGHHVRVIPYRWSTEGELINWQWIVFLSEIIFF